MGASQYAFREAGGHNFCDIMVVIQNVEYLSPFVLSFWPYPQF